MRKVTISRALFEKLKYQSKFFEVLMEHGLEDWIGYDNAKRAFEEEGDN